jgi:hypothetical protein
VPDTGIEAAQRRGPLWAAVAEARSPQQWNEALMTVDEATDPPWLQRCERSDRQLAVLLLGRGLGCGATDV